MTLKAKEGLRQWLIISELLPDMALPEEEFAKITANPYDFQHVVFFTGQLTEEGKGGIVIKQPAEPLWTLWPDNVPRYRNFDEAVCVANEFGLFDSSAAKCLTVGSVKQAEGIFTWRNK